MSEFQAALFVEATEEQKKLLEKANSRIVELENRLEEAGEDADLKAKIKELEAENESLQKQVELHLIVLFLLAGIEKPWLIRFFPFEAARELRVCTDVDSNTRIEVASSFIGPSHTSRTIAATRK